VSCAFHPLQCCTISWKRVTCPFTEQVGVVATLLTLFWTCLVQMLVGLSPVLTTAARIVIFLSLQLNGGLCLTTSDEWLNPNPCLLNLVTKFLFHALCFTRFCCNPPCHFTPLLNFAFCRCRFSAAKRLYFSVTCHQLAYRWFGSLTNFEAGTEVWRGDWSPANSSIIKVFLV